MTDQPTTWTPERALQCLRDWANDDQGWSEWRRMYEDGIDDGEIAQDLLSRCGAMVAEALESAAAEIERLRAELAAKQPAEAEAAQQGPSDEEISQAINRVEDLGYTSTANALWLIARRAGVKL